MNWGNKIVVVLILFVGGIGYMVYVCAQQKDIELVTHDYYEQEIGYQQIIDKQTNFNALQKKPLITEKNTEVLIDFSNVIDYKDIKGEVGFFRPSKSSMDFNTEINLDENGYQYINKEQIIRGKWILKLDWSDTLRNYYSEQVLWIQ